MAEYSIAAHTATQDRRGRTAPTRGNGPFPLVGAVRPRLSCVAVCAAIEYSAMTTSPLRTHHRRAFLRFLAGSPYIAALGGMEAFAQRAPEIAGVITDPKEALNVMDFEEAAHRKV